MTDETSDDQIFAALEISIAALEQRGFSEREVADAMLSYSTSLSIKVRGKTDVARHLQAMTLQITAAELKETAQPRH